MCMSLSYQNLVSSGYSMTTHGQIEAEASVRKEPYSLPQGFSWDTLDLTSPTVVGNVILT